MIPVDPCLRRDATRSESSGCGGDADRARDVGSQVQNRDR